MTREKFDINNLRIASPCSVGWEMMKGDNRIRHCDLCSLNVYNFSDMTTEEVRKLITESEGRVCGRLYRRADGTVLTKDCPVGLRAFQKRVSRFAGAALTAILGLFSVSFGQKKDEKSVDDSKVKIIRTIGREIILSGTITDQHGAVVPGVEITIYKGQIKLKSLVSDGDGQFYISSLTAGNYRLEAQRGGFKFFQSDEILINDKEQVSLDIEIDAEESAIVGLLTVENLVEVDSESKIQTEIMPRKPERPD